MANQNETETEGLEQFTVAELKAMADEKGIDIPSHATKDEIIEALEDKGVTAEGGKKAEGREGESVTPFLTGPVVPIPLAGVMSDAYGIGKKYIIGTADIQSLGAVLQGNFLLDYMPAGSITKIVRIKHSQAVAGPSITACTAQVNDSVPQAYGAAFDVFQAVANTPAAQSTVQLTTGNVGSLVVPTALYLTLVATGGNLGVVTGGIIAVYVRYVIVA